ncbi:GNAT family N-acetyltransferase [Ancylobacter vacuolatus]|uniref:RimJ/RimL family protein N-acetyltransferase n=1 Tax=Ancylobacter vacuolatus TaxID=223389 RepID=A0ABU0DHA5_9HYPH|nr:GNAT family N-acetyltransferase [Ancylobacter vacuolatus]MDQ0347696.1 RimJ/RimL family protein N-acetyltransferase [Ancylobacter vacuolatus]
MLTPPTLTTARLILRPHRAEDFEAYAAMWAEPAVVRFIGGVAFTREAAWSRFLRHPGLWRFLGFGAFAVEERASGAFIGEAGFHDFRRALTPSLEGTMEAGWVFSGAAQGKGYAREAMTAALGWADAHRPGTRITCMIQPSHAASLHVAGTLGFVPLADGLYNGQPMALLERRRATGGA